MIPPLGVTLTADGITIALPAPNATALQLCLFDNNRETRRITLDHRTGDIHHAHIPGIPPGTAYGIRAHGPWSPAHGHRFNPAKLLLDPWATTLDRHFALHPTMRDDASDSAPHMPKAIITAPLPPIVATPITPWPETILYELHVKGFTAQHPDIPPNLRGTFAGLAHRAAIAHLQRLGITAVELLPAAAWIEEPHLARLGLPNHWGYNPIGLLAPDPRLAPGGWPEIRATVAALAEAGIETILDVVLNHTGEGDEHGPTLSLRGLDNAAYYRLNPTDPSRHIDDSGCGNILALDRPAPLRLAMDALRVWARNTGLHGFRFDLATTLGRTDTGFSPTAPLLQAIAQDPVLSRLKHIAEPWDIGPGGYQAGAFPAGWAEWNDRFRNTARRFWRGDAHQRAPLATRLAGSADLFAPKHHPAASLNFITAHDGFTLADLTAYTTKHNQANGEHNRDGTDANHSWNHGTEGPDPALAARRGADQRALLATLLLARGTPMLAMGAELGHTQHGNNNAYAQDNPTTWLDWPAADHTTIAWTAALTALRRTHPALRADRFLTGTPSGPDALPDVLWTDATGTPPDWHADDPTLVMTLAHDSRRVSLVLHRGATASQITLPPPRPGHAWRLLADSADPARAPHDAPSPTAAPASVLLLAETPSARPQADPAILRRLAAAAGIQPAWWTIDGTRTDVSDDTNRALLAAMRLPADTAGAARDSLRHMAEQGPRRPLPRAHGIPAGAPASIPIALDPRLSPLPITLHLTLQDGTTTTLRPTGGTIDRFTACDGHPALTWHLPLPPLPPGRHRLLREDAPHAPCHLTAAPTACHRPAALAHPRFGLAAQLYTLRRDADQGIGDFTTLAILARHAATAGAATIALNPLHMLFPQRRDRASPYFPSDRRFIDPIYLDIPGAPAMPGDAVDYPAIWATKRALLERDFAHFTPTPAFHAFIAERGPALHRFATFQTLAEHHSTDWQHWPEPLRDAASPEVAAFAAAHAPRLAFHHYLQFRADTALSTAGAPLALGLLRDLAVGAAPYGAEAWSERSRLATSAWIGAPPDPFAPQGQNWHLPPPIPHAMADDGYASYAALIAANMRHAGALRIDHVMALSRLFWIPDGASGAEGAYVTYPRDALIGQLALESTRANCLVIGEDLGTVPDGMREALDRAHILGTRVLLLERDGPTFRPPAAYPARAVACVSTHDLPPFQGWWTGADIAERTQLGIATDSQAQRDADKSALALEGGPLVAAHRRLAETPCDLLLVQADDLLATTTSVNLPGTDTERPNWRRRLPTPVETLLDSPLARDILRAVARPASAH